MIGALNLCSIKISAVQRHAAVGAGIAHGKGAACVVAAEDEGDFQQHRLVELIALHPVGGQGAIPEAREHERIGGLALRKIEFGHGIGSILN